MKTVQQILEIKGTQVWSIAPDSTVFAALKLMGEKEVGALTRRRKRPTGRHYLRTR